MKRCCFCGHTLPFDRFHKNRRRSDGRQDQCKVCDRLRVRAIQRAMTELRQLYPAQYLALYEKHRAQLIAESLQEVAS